MKVLAIVAEYNPFHNGHHYHLKKAKEMTQADYCIIVLSGNFTQRGLPALIDRRQRAAMALHAGADLVCSLPIYTSTASATGYAFGAIHLLNAMGVVTDLAFGVEGTDLEVLHQSATQSHLLSLLASNQPKNSDELSSVHTYLKQGYSFPKALSLTLSKDGYFPSKPNAILGLYYLMALHHTNSNIRPMSIERIENNYHDLHLNKEGISSASAIRRAFQDGNIQSIDTQVPNFTLEELINNPIYRENDFNLMYQYVLESFTSNDWINIEDVNQDLSNRFFNLRTEFLDFHQFVALVKNKSLTYNRITRALTHGLLGLTKDKYHLHRQTLNNQWIHILGMRAESSPLLKTIKEKAKVPIIVNTKDINTLKSSTAYPLFLDDLKASQLYHLKKPYNELEQSPMIV